MCTSVALDHLGFNILNEIYPKSKAPSAIKKFKTIEEQEIISPILFNTVQEFINTVRHELEHKRSLSSVYVALHRYLEKFDEEYYITIQDQDFTTFNLQVFQFAAYKALDLYYQVCDAWYHFLTKKNQ